jgi:hypothetical protein
MNALRSAFTGGYFTLTSRFPLGTNVFEREWDVLLVLDACRLDAMRAVAPEYDAIEAVDSVWSVGSASHEWICKTYTEEYRDTIRETALISTNPFVPQVFEDHVYPPDTYTVPVTWPNWRVVEQDDFAHLRQLHEHDHSEHFTPPPPAFVTDHAIDVGRTHDPDRMVVHYFQPHTPYIAGAVSEERPTTDAEDDPWRAIRDGRLSADAAWELYLDNLRLVLDSIERLCRNVDAETVAITADHGDLFGEWGAYGHPEGFLEPNLRRVPWVEITATDERTSHPDVEYEEEGIDVNVENRLEELGYV